MQTIPTFPYFSDCVVSSTYILLHLHTSALLKWEKITYFMKILRTDHCGTNWKSGHGYSFSDKDAHAHTHYYITIHTPFKKILLPSERILMYNSEYNWCVAFVPAVNGEQQCYVCIPTPDYDGDVTKMFRREEIPLCGTTLVAKVCPPSSSSGCLTEINGTSTIHYTI